MSILRAIKWEGERERNLYCQLKWQRNNKKWLFVPRFNQIGSLFFRRSHLSLVCSVPHKIAQWNHFSDVFFLSKLDWRHNRYTASRVEMRRQLVYVSSCLFVDFHRVLHISYSLSMTWNKLILFYHRSMHYCAFTVCVRHFCLGSIYHSVILTSF